MRQQPPSAISSAAAPDPVDEGLVVDAHGPGLVVEHLAQRHVEVARQAAVDGGLGHRHALHLVDALLGVHRERCAAALACTSKRAARGHVVGALHLLDALEAEAVAADDHVVADGHLHVALGLVAAHHRHADDEDAHAQVRQHHAPEAARLRAASWPAPPRARCSSSRACW
jgi:hypothetical protein